MSADSVIIVGAGTVGLITALGLARAGVPVRVLEAAESVPDGAPDMVYSWSVLGELARLGVLADCQQRGLAAPKFAYKVPKTGETLWFDLSVLEGETPYPFNLHVGQREMTEVLLRHLALFPHAQVEWGTTVLDLTQDDAGVSVAVGASGGVRTYSSEWIVGADGARSIVRRRLGLGLAGMTWPDRLVSVNLRFDFETLGFPYAGWQIDPVHGAVLAKVSPDGPWRYTYAEDRTLPEEGVGERARHVLAQVLPDAAGEGVEGVYPYRIHQRTADRYRVGRALLAGDAAHLTNPTRVLGMTSGLFDAFSLTEALAAVIVDGHDDEILDRYSSIRHRNFQLHVSPASSVAKELVFPFHQVSGQPERLRELRAIASAPSAIRDYLLDDIRCGTPSLLTSDVIPPVPPV
jgi:3-(3-hydroxy-phenyl)propionate hydroxylase